MRTSPPKFVSVAALLFSVFILNPSPLMAQGSLTPPGAPAPAMKTLTQVEPRTPITNAPVTISVPGSYYLTANLTVTNGNAITIATNGVTLDLNGFTIVSTAPSATGYGILINGWLSDLAICNGHIRGGVTNNVNGVYSGSGFGYGINYSFAAPANARVAGVSVAGCLYDGIYLGNNDSTVAESCTVRTVGNFGIVASTIKSSVAMNCGGDGVYGEDVSDTLGESKGTGCGVSGMIAQNCYGTSASSYGINAVTAQNCRGFSGSSHGVDTYTALNCYGIASSGIGLYASFTAQNCYGYSSSGTGLEVGMSLNCLGYSESGTGLRFTKLGAMCRGERGSPAAFNYVNGTGLPGPVNLP